MRRPALLLAVLLTVPTPVAGKTARNSAAIMQACASREPARSVEACSKFLTRKKLAKSIRAQALMHRGAAYLRKGNLVKALSDAEAAVRLTHDDADAYYLRASVLRKKNEMGRALADYALALTLRPHFPDLLNDRALVLIDAKDNPGALADLDRAISLEPGHLIARKNRARPLEITWRNEESCSGSRRRAARKTGRCSAPSAADQLPSRRRGDRPVHARTLTKQKSLSPKTQRTGSQAPNYIASSTNACVPSQISKGPQRSIQNPAHRSQGWP